MNISRPLLRSLNPLNVFQINLYKHFNLFTNLTTNKPPKYSMISLKYLPINILPNFWKPISVWKSSLWVLLNIRFPTKDQKLGMTFYQMKKKKCNPTHYIYQESALNYLMLKTNENIFKLISLLIWITEMYIRRSMIRFSALYMSHVSKNSNGFCFYYHYYT